MLELSLISRASTTVEVAKTRAAGTAGYLAGDGTTAKVGPKVKYKAGSTSGVNDRLMLELKHELK